MIQTAYITRKVVPTSIMVPYIGYDKYHHTFMAAIEHYSNMNDYFVTVEGWAYHSISDMFLDWDFPERRILIEKIGFCL